MARISETTEQPDLGSTQGSEKVRFDERLINLLKKNSDFVDDTGELLRDRIKHFAWQFDHDLINLLLTDKERQNQSSLRKSTDAGFSITTPSLTTSMTSTSSTIPTLDSVTKLA